MSNSATDPDSDLRFAIQPYHPLYDVVLNSNPNDAAAATSSRLVPTTTTTTTTTNNNNPKKKRTKVIRPDSSPKSPPRMAAAKREKGPEITMPCSECGKRFWSWKALFGHMRCHPERQWRGINPPPSLLRHRRLGGTTTLSPPPMMMPFSADENDVAACLLLLANAGGPPKPSDGADDSDVIVDRFECSSCKKVFGSHQALGGHRASHKNVKGCFAMAAEDHQNDAVSDAEKRMIVAAASTEPFFGFSSQQQQQHQCGICLRIFSSGQALGGHKRCHWERGSFEYDAVHPLSVITATSSTSRALDLNLPPRIEGEEEEEDDRCCYYSSTSNMALDLRLGL